MSRQKRTHTLTIDHDFPDGDALIEFVERAYIKLQGVRYKYVVQVFFIAGKYKYVSTSDINKIKDIRHMVYPYTMAGMRTVISDAKRNLGLGNVAQDFHRTMYSFLEGIASKNIAVFQPSLKNLIS